MQPFRGYYRELRAPSWAPLTAVDRALQDANLRMCAHLADALYLPRKKLPRVEANCPSCGLPCRGWRKLDGTTLYERCGVCEILKRDWRDGVCRHEEAVDE